MTPQTDILGTFNIYFGEIKDYRVRNRSIYPLDEVLFLCLTGIMSGMDDWYMLEEYGNVELNWLRKYFPYVNGVPSHDTLNRIFSLIKTDSFQKAFIGWSEATFKLPDNFKEEIISIDGKGVRNSATKSKRKLPIALGGSNGAFIVNAWSNARKMCVGQIEISEKYDETKGGLDLLQMLDIQGATITGDANFCQKSTLKYIIDEKADYIMSLKGNKKTLHNEIKVAFEKTTNPVDELVVHSKGHGRVEKRTTRTLNAKEVLSSDVMEGWEGLETIVRTESVRYTQATEVTETQTRYSITSINAVGATQRIAHGVRSHWGVENNLHWQLDVTFREDGATNRNLNTVVNLSIVKKMAYALLKQGQKGHRSMNMLIKKCALSGDFRESFFKF